MKRTFAPMEHASALLQPVRRWTPRRKELLLNAIVAGVVSEDAARRAHHLSAEELDEWVRGFLASGTYEGLRATWRAARWVDGAGYVL